MTRKKISNLETPAEGLIAQHKAELRRYLSRRLYNSSVEVDDVAQETFLRFIRKTDVDLIENPRAYLYKIAAHVVHEMALRNKRYCELPGKDGFDQLESPTTGVDRAEHLSSLKVLLSELPIAQRRVLIAIKHNGKNYKEVANELGLSTNTVKKYAFLATLHCRKRGWL